MSRSTSDAQSLVKALMELPENCMCADCQHKVAKWASTTLGVFICIDCSGIHRNLGTHITLVRSCTLDSWTPEQARVMKKVGNRIGNQYWEANLPKDFIRPSSTDRLNMESFIRAKYIQRLWAAPGDPPHLQVSSFTYFAPMPMQQMSSHHEHKRLPFSKSNDNLEDMRKSTKSSMNLNDFMKLMNSHNENQQKSTNDHSQTNQLAINNQIESHSEPEIKTEIKIEQQKNEPEIKSQITKVEPKIVHETKNDIKKIPTPPSVKGSTAQEIMMMANVQKPQKIPKFAKRNKNSNATISKRPSNDAVFEQMLQMSENSNRPDSAPILQVTQV